MEHKEWYISWSHTYLRLSPNAAKLHNLQSDLFIFLKHKHVERQVEDQNACFSTNLADHTRASKPGKHLLRGKWDSLTSFAQKHQSWDDQSARSNAQALQSSVYMIERIPLNLGGEKMLPCGVESPCLWIKKSRGAAFLLRVSLMTLGTSTRSPAGWLFPRYLSGYRYANGSPNPFSKPGVYILHFISPVPHMTACSSDWPKMAPIPNFGVCVCIYIYILDVCACRGNHLFSSLEATFIIVSRHIRFICP